MIERRWVVDTNVLVAHALMPAGTAARAVERAARSGVLLVSRETLAELVAVLARKKFVRYLTSQARLDYLRAFAGAAKLVEIHWCGAVCRDPNDDKFLHVAVNGQADAIITGDADLLALHPFHGVDILTPADFLRRG
ncbi:MAG: putative toxin-antitoxin system toxin component, PIN family [Proteobacteria bacterium]|nr:putative toxin-antitoxin system toxin component, PIN family [Pseudomonadota bacterium]